MSSIALIGLAIVLAAILIGVRRIRHAQSDLRRLREYEFFAQKFFASSNAIVRTDEAPEGLLDAIAFLNDSLANEPAARRFFNAYEEALSKSIDGEALSQPDPEVQEFLRRRPEMGRVLDEALLSGLLAMTFLEERWGWRARALLADSIGRDRRPNTVFATLRRERRRAAPADPDLAYA